jgi:sialate O-acetylesterase
VLPLICIATAQDTALKLPSIFADNMVLQREIAVPFFGTGRPGQNVTVQVGANTARTTVRPDGTWMAKLAPLKAGGPYTATVTGDRTIRYQNVLVGEVWIASGQSNMEWTQGNADDAAMALKEADPHIRMFTVAHVSTEEPQKDFQGSWAVSSRSTVPMFSAVANAFAKEIHKALGVPVGIIHTSWGGTPAESWTSREMLLKNKNLAPLMTNYFNTIKDFPQKQAAYEKAYAEWNAKVFHLDPGNKGYAQGWASLDGAFDSWKVTNLPATLEFIHGPMDGAAWFRKSVDIPRAWVGKDLTLELGPIDDFDVTYVNGVQVGETTNKTPGWYMVPRVYKVPAGVLREGRNMLAVRVYDTTASGGFTGQPDQLRWGPSDKSSAPISLAGQWLTNVEVRFDEPSRELMNQQPQAPFGPGNPWAPGGLYNAMIAPMIPYAIRGAIWYQGESNAGRAYQYRELFPAMIRDWRNRWGQGNFPFYWVSLANFTPRNDQPVESDWAELREAQTMTMSLPNSGQALAIDIGEAGDIHPRNKREVGRRLALNALAQTYGLKVPFSGPQFDGYAIEGRRVRVRFKYADGLGTSDGAPVVGFAVAGPDRKFYWADARIDGNSVVVSSPSAPNPVAVRYGWSNNPAVNLINGADLPATPFRTDSWPGITAPK